MSIDDRIRTATEATAATVREIRPLNLPPGAVPARGHRSRHAHPARAPRRWLSWGAPIAAAALVTAVALALVLLRQAPPQPGPAAPTSAPSATAPVPRYYAFLDRTGGIVVADDQAGRTLKALAPPAGQDFTGVTAAADDRTFVLSSFDKAKAETTWYLLRVTPGAADPARLTQLPIQPLRAQVSGLALSQDGRELAVMFATSSLQLWTYSVSSGALLGSWRTDTDYWMLRTAGANAYGLSWLADGRHVAFRFDAYAKNSLTHLVTVRALDVTAAGHDLMADSRLDLQVPLSVTRPADTEPCSTSLAAPDGGSVICGTADLTGQIQPSCTGTPSSLVSYSTATGQQLRVLYHDSRPCPGMAAVPLWTDSSGSQVIALISGTAGAPGQRASVFGLIVAGHLTVFPVSVLYPAPLVGGLGTMAF